MNITYPSDLSDTEWACLQHYLRESRSDCRTRRHSLRTIFNAIFYILRTGCPWRYLPSSFPPWQTVFYHFRRLRLRGRWTVLYTALHYAERQGVGRDPHPSAAIMDAQSVKTAEESAHISGFDAYKRVKGRKRHLLVDTLGIPLSYYVTPADMHDTQGARRLLGGLKYSVPRREDHLGGQRVSWQGLGRLVQDCGWLGSRRSQACPWNKGIRRSTKEVDRRTHRSVGCRATGG
jgi:putative transposase